ncbi:MAG: IreB family regulatory phosphoprotein [Bacillota bacterium]
MNDSLGETIQFSLDKEELLNNAHDILMHVYHAMKEKGYDPINQLVGYIVSGDPTYITSHNNARYLIRRLERDELLEEVVGFYLEQKAR